jgi:phosphatidylethanolamine-binding protein (PEBP) family uncharacterized protein
MKLWSDSIKDGEPISPRYALGRPHPTGHVELADNVSPHVAWANLPPGTRSLALLLVDVDAPSRRDDANQEGRVVPADLPRADFYHLALVDLPPHVPPLLEGELSTGVTPQGKRGPASVRGARAGLNDYTGWFKGDPGMEGLYFGYDGPCPPWNDSRVHRYYLRLFALDLARCPVSGAFTGGEMRAAIAGHVLAEASLMGTYTINPDAVWVR